MPEQQVWPFLQMSLPHSSSGGTGGHFVIVQPHLPPASTQVGPAVDPSQHSCEGEAGAGLGHAPFAVQSSFGGGGGGWTGTVVVGPGVGFGSGHDRISQRHVVPFVLMHRPVLPPIDPSEQSTAGIPIAGPHALAPQSFSSAESVSVGLSVRSLPSGVLEHAATPAARGASAIRAKQKVRAFIGVSSV